MMTKSLTWYDVLSQERRLPYFQQILTTISIKRKSGITIYPPDKEVFNAFRLTKLSSVKVVIIGQDPYHGPNQAHGLSFSVNPGIAIPPSLSNVYKELVTDIPNFRMPKHGFLQSWAKQGVMLLNTILTVEAGKARSHANLGWEKFTDKVIRALNIYHQGIIFLLWGTDAQKKSTIINSCKHHILTASHPSPLSAHRGFFGCRHFSKTNFLLIHQGQSPINWIPTLSLNIANGSEER